MALNLVENGPLVDLNHYALCVGIYYATYKEFYLTISPFCFNLYNGDSMLVRWEFFHNYFIAFDISFESDFGPFYHF